jgi:type VI secretion system protein ImpL
MKAIFMKILKIFLIIAGVLLLTSLVFGLVLVLDWPLWVGIFLLLIIVGIFIGIFFFRKILARKREQKFVQQVIEQDESHLQTLTGKERDESKELQGRWKEAIEILRRSHLRKYGNPLYVLPWYLVIGESGSGKTTAISSARLSSPFAEFARTTGISGTRNCDWWFFEQAIILDTAGRYAIPVDEGRDKDEWQKFLNLLVKYRKKEPLNGIIVTVAADKLAEAQPAVLEEDGRNIRRRIDELMRVLGAKFPVYVLVTKADLIQGMAQFSDLLPEKSLEQPMGVINQDLSTDIAGFLSKTVSIIGERLRNLRILLMNKPESRAHDPGFLLFPEEFENLKGSLEIFLKTAFQENPYQETPIFRGLFYSSGRQEGRPYSHFLKALGLIQEKEVLPGTSKGLFLHDFFEKILPRERGLFAPTKRAVEWSLLTRNLGLTSWIVIGIALCGLLSFSFVKNLSAIRKASHEFVKPPVMVGDFLPDLITMDRFYQATLNVEQQNKNWWIPRFGLKESIKVENGLKERFCNQFQNGFLTPFDKQMEVVLRHMSASTPDETIGEYIVHLVRRLNLLKSRLKEENIDTLQARPQPFYVSLVPAAEQEITPEIRKKFGTLYLYYTLWRPDVVEINKEVATLELWLNHLVNLKRTNLKWVVEWVNTHGTLAPVTLKEFWGGSLEVRDEKPIAPAYTREGKKMIDTFISEFESSLTDPLAISSSKTEFDKWYSNAAFDAWQNFAFTFPKGVERLNGIKEWQQMAMKVSADEGPYYAFLNKMASELEPVASGGNLPPWVQQVYQFQLIKSQGLAGKAAEKVREEGKKFTDKIGKMLGSKKPDQTSRIESQSMAAKAFQDYQNALSTLVPMTSSRNQAYQMTSQAYSEDPAASKAPFYLALEAATRMRNNIGTGRADDEVFWKIVSGPMLYLWAYARMETACYLQSQWEEKVLSETQGAADPQAIQFLLAQEGPVWKFIKGPAAPFIGWSLQKGYYSKEILGGSVPFDSALFDFLSKGAKMQPSATAGAKQNYSVSIKGMPTDVNPEARMKPQSTRLELHCSGTTYSLVNLNYPVTKTFSWSSEICNDVLFQIEIGDMILIKKYVGSQAFPEFLEDFQAGQHIFSPNDFPAEKASLERLGIKYIRANYQFSGDQRVILQARLLPGQLPRKIVQCWQ